MPMYANLDINSCKGFTYIGLLLLIAITSIALSVGGISWQYQVRSEKEQQLLFVGKQFRNAIDSYYASSPGDLKVYPLTLNDLLEDKRMPNTVRHLRQIYLDPMTGKSDWIIQIQQGHIVGVHSRSTLAPFKIAGFNDADAKFSGAKTYQQWVFESASKVTLSNSSRNLSVSNPDAQYKAEDPKLNGPVGDRLKSIADVTNNNQPKPLPPEANDHPGDRLRYILQNKN